MAANPSLNWDLELDLIREFSVGGVLLGTTSPQERREHIRVSIYRGNLVHKPFRDTGYSYAQAYEVCFGTPLEMRSVPRTKPTVDPQP
jgi:hypothetical protein